MFITFEGVEGSGKTTIIKLVEEELKKNYSVLISREPGGSRFAESIRRLLLDVKNKDITYHTEALLYAASHPLLCCNDPHPSTSSSPTI